MKKVMILGSAGMLGHMVYHYLSTFNKYTIFDASYPEKLHRHSKLLDVTNTIELKKYIETEDPDIVINCIGILIKGSQSDPSNAIYLNSFFPHYLINILRKTGGRLIHVSTDCVFSGEKGNYTEKDFRDADDIYGRSKALGEVINNTDVTLRTSIVGPELKKNGEGLFHWFMHQKGKINGFTKALWGGVTTLELAKVIDEVIDKNITGLIHITNKQSISKYDLLKLFRDTFNKNDIEICPINGKLEDKSLKSIRNDLNYKIPSYNKMIEELHDWIINYPDLYSSNYIL